jgi:hypothetical protein
MKKRDALCSDCGGLGRTLDGFKCFLCQGSGVVTTVEEILSNMTTHHESANISPAAEAGDAMFTDADRRYLMAAIEFRARCHDRGWISAKDESLVATADRLRRWEAADARRKKIQAYNNEGGEAGPYVETEEDNPERSASDAWTEGKKNSKLEPEESMSDCEAEKARAEYKDWVSSQWKMGR